MKEMKTMVGFSVSVQLVAEVEAYLASQPHEHGAKSRFFTEALREKLARETQKEK